MFLLFFCFKNFLNLFLNFFGCTMWHVGILVPISQEFELGASWKEQSVNHRTMRDPRCSAFIAGYLSLASSLRVSQLEPHRSPSCPGVPATTGVKSHGSVKCVAMAGLSSSQGRKGGDGGVGMQ